MLHCVHPFNDYINWPLWHATVINSPHPLAVIGNTGVALSLYTRVKISS